MRQRTAAACRRAIVAVACLMALLPWLAAPARGHDVSSGLQISGFVRAEGDRLHVVLRVPLELLLNVDLPKKGDGYLDLTQVDDAFPRALKATTKDIEFFANGQRLAPSRGDARIALPSDASFGSYEHAVAAVRGPRLPAHTQVFWNQGYFDALLEYPIGSPSDTFEVDFHVARGLGERLKLNLRYVTADAEVRAFEIVTGAGRITLDPRWYQAAATFTASGFRHILGGADHLLFLLCLIVPFRRLNWSLVGVVTAFTVAHSITLIASAYGHVPSGDWFAPLVETLIAASILYMAIENVLGPNLHRRWCWAGLFGLVHGFGFSFALAQDLQFAGSHLMMSLLAFNIGIELGQLLVLALLWPLLHTLMARAEGVERIVVLVISAFVAHAAWHWLLERFKALTQSDFMSLFETIGLARAATVVLAAAAIVLILKAWRPRRPAAHATPQAQSAVPRRD